LGKVFGHCDKLNRKNYEIWLAGLISAITGLTVASKFYQQVEKTLRYIKTNAHLKLEEIELHVGSAILTLTLHAGDRTRGAFQEFNAQLYHVFNLTIHDSLTSVKKTLAGSSYFEDGLKAAVYFYENLGPGDSTSRTVTKLDILKIKQSPEETVAEFGDRMSQQNEELVNPLDDHTLVAIFAQGCSMAEIKTHLVGKISEKDYNLDGIIKVAKTFEKTLGLWSHLIGAYQWGTSTLSSVNVRRGLNNRCFMAPRGIRSHRIYTLSTCAPCSLLRPTRKIASNAQNFVLSSWLTNTPSNRAKLTN
jgi:hypothetical protein